MKDPIDLYISLLEDCVLHWPWLDAATKKDRELGRDWPNPGQGETMIGRQRLNSLRHCVEATLKEGVPGDLVETGVWRGGACILMRGILAAYGDTQRNVWVADSFEGVPPTAIDDDAAWLSEVELLRVPQEEVSSHFEKYGLLDGQVKFLSGLFSDTLADAPISSIAVLRLDGDLYESTRDGLEALYPKISSGGFCIVDDYATFESCKKATDEYRKSHGISDPIIDIDGWGVFWRKSA